MRPPFAFLAPGGGGGGPPPFDPATLPLSMWNRAPYSGSPLVGVASAGASSGRNLVEATNPPSAGTPVNALAPASFDGTNDLLTLDSIFADAVFGSTDFWFAMLVKLNAPPADSGTSYLNPLLLGDTNGNYGLSFYDGGVQFFMYDAGWVDAEVACTPNAWHLIQCWHDGTDINVEVDGVAGTSSPVDLTAWFNIYSNAMDVRLAANGFAASFAAFDLLEVMAAAEDVGGTARTNVRSYVNAHYALSL